MSGGPTTEFEDLAAKSKQKAPQLVLYELVAWVLSGTKRGETDKNIILGGFIKKRTNLVDSFVLSISDAERFFFKAGF